MPFYDLRCPICDKEYNVSASMADKTEKHIPCPDCGSFDLEAIYISAPGVIKSVKTPECPNSHVCGTGCRHGG
jgi:putative FmdB family regulatory protein